MEPLGHGLEQAIADQKKKSQKRKEKDNLETLEDHLDNELLLLTRPKKARAAAPCRSREYMHNTIVRTTSTKLPKKISQARKNHPRPASQIHEEYWEEVATEPSFDNSGIDSDAQAKLDDLLASINVSIDENQPVSDWQKRMDTREENWESFRWKLFEETVMYSAIPADSVCCLCGSDTPQVRCHQCGASHYMCTACDKQVHQYQPLHDREVWCNGVFKAVPSTSFCSIEGGLQTEKVGVPFSVPWNCPVCKEGKITAYPKESKRIVVNLRGCYDLNDVIPVCNLCGEQIVLETPHDVIREQYWPGNPIQKSAYMFDSDLFLFYDLLKKHNPGLSEVGFLRTLEQFSLSKGRVGSVNAATFGKAFREWRYCQFSIQKLKHSPQFDCPCCTPQQHSVHFDGNKKLYRYSKVPRGTSKQYYEEFIVPNELVDEHLNVIGYFGEKNDGVGLCGTTRWKAAKAVSKTMTSLDETGLEVAGCRHALALKALNMFRGEIFGYPHYLHTKHFSKVQCVWADVICQYWPWALSKANSCPDGMSSQPCLSVMHAKAHSWHCQILWGGRWQPNAAGGAGEEMEQLFSYLSRFNLTTKYMSAAGREEQLTEAAMFWNSRKIRSLPGYLKRRLMKTRQDLCQLKKDLLLLQDELGKDLTPEYCDQCLSDVQEIARRETSGNVIDDAVEQQKVNYFGLKNLIQTALQLHPLVRGPSSAMSILTGSEQLYAEIEKLGLSVSSRENQEQEIARLKSLIHENCGISVEEVDRECELAAARATTVKLQEKIELVYLTAQRRHTYIQKLSTSSKQRASLRKAITSDHKKLKKLVNQYNGVIDHYKMELPCVLENDALCGKFPWSSFSSRHCVSVQEKYKISTIFNQIKRLKEEESLLLLEMTQYLEYFKVTVPEKLLSEICDLACSLKSVTVDTVPEKNLNREPGNENHERDPEEASTVPDVNKYAVRNKDNRHVLEGLLAIKRSGVIEAQVFVENAAREFQNELELSKSDSHFDYIYDNPVQDSDSDLEYDTDHE